MSSNNESCFENTVKRSVFNYIETKQNSIRVYGIQNDMNNFEKNVNVENKKFVSRGTNKITLGNNVVLDY